MKELLLSLKKISTAQTKINKEVAELERALVEYIDFKDYSIVYQPSDNAFMLEFDSENAILSQCIAIIQEKGKLSLEDYMTIAHY